jgi:hypothetical protein
MIYVIQHSSWLMIREGVREIQELIWSMEDEGSIDLSLGSIMPSYLGIRRLMVWARDKS